MQLTIALAQMAITPGRPDLNEAEARRQAAQAAAAGAGLLLLPELWPTGYDLARAADYAAPLDSGHFALMAGIACACQLHVLGTALEASPSGRPYNTATLYTPDGRRAAHYRKVHLFPPMGEVEHLSPGDALPVFDLPWGRTALAICYDLRFPEMWRRYTQAGAQLILIPAEWPIRRVEHWRLLLKARAVENQLFVAGCNRAGEGSDCSRPVWRPLRGRRSMGPCPGRGRPGARPIPGDPRPGQKSTTAAATFPGSTTAGPMCTRQRALGKRW